MKLVVDNREKRGGRSGKAPSGLTVKQEAFAQAVAEGHSYAESYRRAFQTDRMGAKTIHVHASNMAKRDDIRKRVEEIHGEMLRGGDMMQDASRSFVLDRLMNLADNAEREANKLKALELLGKSIGMFTERIEKVNAPRDVATIERELKDALNSLKTIN